MLGLIASRLGGEGVEGFFSRIESRFDLGIAVRHGNEAGFEGRRGQVDPAFEHVVEVALEVVGVALHHLGKGGYGLFLTEETAEHATNLIGREWDASGVCAGF